jgi:hypothetical protein
MHLGSWCTLLVWFFFPFLFIPTFISTTFQFPGPGLEFQKSAPKIPSAYTFYPDLARKKEKICTIMTNCAQKVDFPWPL